MNICDQILQLIKIFKNGGKSRKFAIKLFETKSSGWVNGGKAVLRIAYSIQKF